MERLGGKAAAALTAPEPISARHEFSGFHSGHAALDQWLKERALRSEGLSARTYVVCAGSAAVGYYCLSTGAVARASAPKRITRNMPDPVPVVLLGRLAVHRDLHGAGIGGALLRDALARTLSIASVAGVRALLVHAIDDAAASFYRRYGFETSPMQSGTLMLAIETVRASLSDKPT